VSIAIGTASSITLSLSGSQAAGQQPAITAARSGDSSQTLNGTLSLSFASSVSGVSNDPNIQFVQANSSAGSRLVAFNVPFGSAQANFANGATRVSTGTVAGVISITGTLTDASGNALPAPGPLTVNIPASAPVVTKVILSTGSGSFTVAVTGFSTPRDMRTITFHFVTASGTTLTQSDIPVDVASAFANYYSSAASRAFGSQFTASVPFTFPGTSVPISSVTVDATNSQGTSARSSSASP
jgi:hypothetical protein